MLFVYWFETHENTACNSDFIAEMSRKRKMDIGISELYVGKYEMDADYRNKLSCAFRQFFLTYRTKLTHGKLLSLKNITLTIG